MRTMSLFESGDSNGQVSLFDLKNGKINASVCDKTLDDYAFCLCRGGWPLAIGEDEDVALQQAIDYYENLVIDDIFSIKDIPLVKDEQKARRVLRSYARNCSTQCGDKVIKEDVSSNAATFDISTLDKYLSSLRRLFVIEDLPAWNPSLRSKTAIRTKDTRHFVDTSIACAALGIGPNGLFNDMKTFGLLFEDMAVRDLRIYADVDNANILHYRDKNDREVDAVVVFKDGDWGLVEIKLANEDEIGEAAAKLISLAKDINEEKKPSFLAIVTATKFAFQREDVVFVVPLGCLKP